MEQYALGWSSDNMNSHFSCAVEAAKWHWLFVQICRFDQPLNSEGSDFDLSVDKCHSEEPAMFLTVVSDL